MITVNNLVKMLQEMIEEDSSVGDRIVVLSSDPEGNSFRAFFGDINTNNVFDEDEREVRLEELTPELEEQGYSEEDIGEGKPCIVLWP